jgi:hypothetical protein
MNLQIEAFVFQLYENFLEKIINKKMILKFLKKLKMYLNLFLMHGNNYQGKVKIK